MIRNAVYKDRPAIAVGSEHTCALFLPEDGGKLVSLQFGEREYLAQRDGEQYRRLFVESNYVDCECSAFDDMFPTIDPCVIEGCAYLDHGEVARSVWDAEIGAAEVTLRCRLKEIDAVFAKTVFMEDDTLCIRYTMENLTDRTLPYIWAGHIMLVGEKGAWVESPFGTEDAISVVFGKPISRESAHVLPAAGAVGEYKFYYDDPRTPMQCAVVYPAGGKVTLTFDNDVVKYLGIWANPGALNGMYNLALEPCSAPYDDPIRAEKAGKGSYLPPRATVQFTLKISYSEDMSETRGVFQTEAL